jgi:SAM-dependent methyltransferase
MVCANTSDNALHAAREMMFGLEDTFEYIECRSCGCLQIAVIPENLSRFYPDRYYGSEPIQDMAIAWHKRLAHRQLTGYWLAGSNPVGRLLSRRYSPPVFVEWARRGGVCLDSAILDVGCGTGSLLLSLAQHGFSTLLGADPFIKHEIRYSSGVRVLRKHVAELDGAFDFIMLHHSFEHMPDPLPTLQKLYSLLNPDRYVLIRTPVAASFAWREYGVDWVQLDAPRHLFVHSLRSMQLLADGTGFEVLDVVFDSTEFQFWGSEQYRCGIPLEDDRSFSANPERSIFSPDDMRQFRARAAELNALRDGDQACFYLYKRKSSE